MRIKFRKIWCCYLNFLTKQAVNVSETIWWCEYDDVKHPLCSSPAETLQPLWRTVEGLTVPACVLSVVLTQRAASRAWPEVTGAPHSHSQHNVAPSACCLKSGNPSTDLGACHQKTGPLFDSVTQWHLWRQTLTPSMVIWRLLISNPWNLKGFDPNREAFRLTKFKELNLNLNFLLNEPN